MKKYISIILLFFMASMSQAQSNLDEINLMQSIFGMDKKEVVAGYVEFSPAQEDAFWKLYNEYETQRQDLGKARMELLQKYTNKKGNITNQQAKDLMAEAVPLRAAGDKLILNYTKRIEKATNALVSVQFYQIENYISDGMRFAILNNIDFIQDKQ